MAQKKAPQQIKPTSLDDYLEVMSKAVFQTGISWSVVDAKWPQIKEAFLNFDINEIIKFDDSDVDRLAKDQRVIRNYRKLEAIVSNARRMIELETNFTSFREYLNSHGDFEAILKAMKKDFKFMGPTACYYFLYVVGEKVPSHNEFESKYRK